MTDLRTVGVVGGGAIGASWAALALHRGLDVLVADPDVGLEPRLRAEVATRLSELGSTGDDAGMAVIRDLGELGGRADIVLEAGPERLDVKREIFAELDAAAPGSVLLTSSSSGLPPSSIQTACTRHPERVLVAHPFNPPHLMPLVEIVGGHGTSPEALDRAMTVFTSLGKQPIRLRRELPGHVANRLQAALWREAYHLVQIGAASVSDIDTAIAAGPGLRWSLLGPFTTQHLSGGDGGLAHVLEHLGPPMVDWWRDLGEPELTPELVDTLVAGVRDELDGVDEADLRARRDAALRDLMDIKVRRKLDAPDR